MISAPRLGRETALTGYHERWMNPAPAPRDQ
jgi:hypothetical protein